MSKRSAVRGIAALSAAFVASVGLATAANAADPVEPRLMPTETTGSLTIHKYSGNPTDLPNNGLAQTMPTGDGAPVPLEGAGFTVKHLSCTDDATSAEMLDLTTNQGWINAAEIFKALGSNPSATDLTEIASIGGTAATCTLTQFDTEQFTDSNGVTTFASMPLGLYYVTETTTPEAHKTVLPFLVTVPMTHPTDLNAWVYNVNVYPKDRPESVKVVNDQDVTSTESGDLVQWTITSLAPYNADGTKGYYMIDKLDPRLGFDETTADVTVWLGGAGVASDGTGAVVFTKGTDYTITPTVDTSVTPNVTTVLMELTAAGRDKLDDAVAVNKALYMNWSFKTTVSGTGTIENDATIFDNTPYDASNTCAEGDPSCSTTPAVSTKFGGVKIIKTANDATGGDPATVLAGAEFKVLASHTEADACNEASAGVADSGVWDTGITATTAADGIAVFSQLRASDWANGAQLVMSGSPATPPAEWMFYCLIETKAPAGYELLPEGIPFQIITGTDNNLVAGATEDDKGKVTWNSTAYELVADGGTIINVPSKAGFQLPLTGGIGTAILLIIGAGVLSATFVYARKQNQKAKAA